MAFAGALMTIRLKSNKNLVMVRLLQESGAMIDAPKLRSMRPWAGAKPKNPKGVLTCLINTKVSRR